MRLLNTTTLEFGEFFDDKIPEYTILSHRWSDEEVTYEDFLTGRRRDGYGYRKITKLCEITRTRGIDWTWIDACCIDKKSSAELTEAVNSMYAWYNGAKVCYVFLPDVHPCREPELARPPHPATITDLVKDNDTGRIRCAASESSFYEEEFRNSVWWTRGWTLQELLSPQRLLFFNSAFQQIGSRRQLPALISEVSRIGKGFFDVRGLNRAPSISFATKMSWAAHRRTSRVEDIVYSLLGILDVNMPLLYGEGRERAFMRLQKEYLARYGDDSVFVWDRSIPVTAADVAGTAPLPRRRQFGASLLAPDPAAFGNSGNIVRSDYSYTAGAAAGSPGIELLLPVPEAAMEAQSRVPIMYELNCQRWDGTRFSPLLLRASIRVRGRDTWYGRADPSSLGPIMVENARGLFHYFDREQVAPVAAPPFRMGKRGLSMADVSTRQKMAACGERSMWKFWKYWSKAIAFRRVSFR